MIDELKQIAYNEGVQAYADGFRLTENPYEGVSETLYDMWFNGFLDVLEL